jgi:S-DNA-T family DNA segregation ATPase FtsK/SpoIIIE
VTISALSRRVSEFVGVTLFAIALIWVIALASYSASDPVWFFNTGSSHAPANFAGRIGAFVAELSYQLLGYSAYLIPVVAIVIGWHYFWCRTVDAAYTKLIGAALLFGCVSAFLSLAFGTVDVRGKGFRAGGYLGDWLAATLADYLNRSGSIILILTLLFLAIILSTQFSFGRLFSAIGQLLRGRLAALAGAYREWREEKRRDKQRQEVLKKHLDKAPKEDRQDTKPTIAARVDATEPPAFRPAPKPGSDPRAGEDVKKPSRTAAVVGAAAAALKAAAARPTPTRATI